MRIFDRLVIRSLQPFLPEGTEVLAVERVETNALGEERKARAVLTADDLFVVTPVRMKSVLTQVPRADICSVEELGPDRVTITYDDFAKATRRVIELELKKSGDGQGLLAALAG